jgi:hypothetical protein
MNESKPRHDGRAANAKLQIHREQLKVMARGGTEQRPTNTIDSDITCDVYCWWWSYATK